MSFLLRGITRCTLRSSRMVSSLKLSSFSVNNNAESMLDKPELMTTLRNVESPSAVLSLVQPGLTAMEPRELLQALQVLFEMSKCHEPGELSLTREAGFAALCRRLAARARDMELDDLIDATKILTFLQVPVDAPVVQTLLQLLRHSINQLNLRQIMFLHFLLSRHAEPNALADALRLALPLAFQIHLPLELAGAEPGLLRDALCYSCARALPGRAAGAAAAALLAAGRPLDAGDAKAIVWALSEVNCTPERHAARAELLGAALAALAAGAGAAGAGAGAAGAGALPYADLVGTLRRARRRVADRHLEFYHEPLLDAAGERARGEGFYDALKVARELSKMAHTDTQLAEHLCALAEATPTLLSEAPPHALLDFINYLSNNNYTPSSWPQLVPALARHAALRAPAPGLPWVKLCLELASLGVFLDEPLDLVYSEAYLDKVLETGGVLDLLQLLTLHEAAVGAGAAVAGEGAAAAGAGAGRRLPERVAARARAAVPLNPASRWLCAELARALGGADLVARDVLMPNGFVADALICLKNGYPLSLAHEQRDARTPLAELGAPADAVVVCVKLFKPSCFSTNSNRLRGVHRLVPAALERLGAAAVVVHAAQAARAPPHERGPWLLRELGSRCAELAVRVSPAG